MCTQVPQAYWNEHLQCAGLFLSFTVCYYWKEQCINTLKKLVLSSKIPYEGVFEVLNSLRNAPLFYLRPTKVFVYHLKPQSLILIMLWVLWLGYYFKIASWKNFSCNLINLNIIIILEWKHFIQAKDHPWMTIFVLQNNCGSRVQLRSAVKVIVLTLMLYCCLQVHV